MDWIRFAMFTCCVCLIRNIHEIKWDERENLWEYYYYIFKMQRCLVFIQITELHPFFIWMMNCYCLSVRDNKENITDLSDDIIISKKQFFCGPFFQVEWFKSLFAMRYHTMLLDFIFVQHPIVVGKKHFISSSFTINRF